jgi:hypothetical protein
MSSSVHLLAFDPEFGPQRIIAFDDASMESVGPETLDLCSVSEPEEVAFEDAAPTEAEITQDIIEAITALSRTVGDVYAETAATLAQDLGQAMRELTPTLLDTGFAAEVAAAVGSILQRTIAVEAQLHVSPDHLDRITSATAGLKLEHPLTLVSDSSLPPGSAELRWPEGGAVFDRDALSSAAQQILEDKLSIPAENRSTNE